LKSFTPQSQPKMLSDTVALLLERRVVRRDCKELRVFRASHPVKSLGKSLRKGAPLPRTPLVGADDEGPSRRLRTKVLHARPSPEPPRQPRPIGGDQELIPAFRAVLGARPERRTFNRMQLLSLWADVGGVD
jgi:hypothetical protein